MRTGLKLWLYCYSLFIE